MAANCKKLFSRHTDKMGLGVCLAFLLTAAVISVQPGSVGPEVPAEKKAVPFKIRHTRSKTVTRKTGVVSVRVATFEALEGKWRVWYPHDRFTSGEKSFDVYRGCAIGEINGQRRSFTVAGVEPRAVTLEEEREYLLPDDATPFKLQEIVQRPVDVLFRGFVDNPFTVPYDITLVWGGGRKSHYVPLGQTFHGYRVYPLEKRTVEEPGAPGGKRDRYFITLKKEREHPVVIEMGKTVRITDRIATLEVKEGKWRVTHRDEKLSSGEKVFEVFDGCIIRQIEGERREFTITRLADNTVTLKERISHVLRVSSE